MEHRIENPIYAAIAERLIETKQELSYIKDSSVRIIYLESDQTKHSGAKIVHAECEKIPAKYHWSIPADFTITVFKKNCEGFSDEQFEILLFHELLHVGIERVPEGELYSIVPHDLEDFKLIIDQYGTDWSQKAIHR